MLRVKRIGHRLASLIFAAATLMVATAVGASGQEIGRAATSEEITAWDIDVAPDGEGLPAGSGAVMAGQKLYEAQCLFCHGPTGAETRAHSLIKPRLRNFWCCATSVYDYIYRAMPFHQPQSLQPDELYSLTAYVLFLNGIVPEDFVADAETLPAVEMPRAPSYAFNPWTTPDKVRQPGDPWSSENP
ncbi:cytochrome c [Chelativorans sp. AA-79]|uniref:c-type cytochrome n=1 Tax=Chelativorans sp. AA-79 TaxID=3028735 RepID=UPI0023F96C4F|nr:cytochrome c [Chelativorans sp. AA-79]WEX12239.1 cytochrome c [Chelativorans sp. AA-79]